MSLAFFYFVDLLIKFSSPYPPPPSFNHFNLYLSFDVCYLQPDLLLKYINCIHSTYLQQYYLTIFCESKYWHQFYSSFEISSAGDVNTTLHGLFWNPKPEGSGIWGHLKATTLWIIDRSNACQIALPMKQIFKSIYNLKNKCNTEFLYFAIDRILKVSNKAEGTIH